MGWYDYKCTKCNHIKLDIERNIKENVSVYICPTCGSEMKQIYKDKIEIGYNIKVIALPVKGSFILFDKSKLEDPVAII